MLRSGLVLAALCLLPAMASAQVRGPWEVVLSGNGLNGNKFNGFSAAANASIGYFITDNFEISAHEWINYSDFSGVSFFASSVGAIDFHLPLGDQNQFLPFIGANIGYVYGHPVRNTWEAAPEAGLKWFVGPDVFILAMVQYQFFFRNGGSSSVTSGFNNGQWVYGLGVGFRF